MEHFADTKALAAAIDFARSNDALGRSAHIRRLFEYLAARTLEGRSPKESEVAIEVFSRSPDFDPTRDSIARVYVHKLRQRLEGITDENGCGLTIPLGEYRLALSKAEPKIPPDFKISRLSAFSVVAAFLCLLVVISIWASRPSGEQAQAAQSEVWASLLENGRPTIIALGDYYIFADIGAKEGGSRLVREYTVNSATDLDRFRRDNPERGSGYLDLDLRYLPVGSADGLMAIGGLFDNKPRPSIVPVSKLTAAMMRDNNIIYIGYFSGLGVLRDPAFGGSRYIIGETFDDIIDTKTNRRFQSGGGAPDRNDAIYKDYGYFSTFAGPAGNRFVIIAGTRDAGLSQMSQTAMNPEILNKFAGKTGSGLSSEGLFSVSGLKEANIESALIELSPLDQSAIWRQDSRTIKTFPAG